MFANNISNKVLVFKIYKELLKLNSKNSNNTSKKNGERTWTFFQRRYMNTQQVHEKVLKISSVQFSHSVMSDSLRPHESQDTRPPCPSPTPRVHSNSCLLSRWCHPTISSSVIPFSSCPQSLSASESFPMSQLFTWVGQSITVSALASVLPMNTQDWSPLE